MGFLVACLLLTSPWVHAASKVRAVESLSTSLSPVRVIDQLHVDLALQDEPSASLELPAAAADLGRVLAVLQTKDSSAAVPGTQALHRIELAREVLGRFDPAEFAKKPAAEQDAVLAGLWDAWRERGLVDESGPAAFDRILLEAVNDKRLTHSNKSVFLGAAILGYPLQDAVWLSQTRINDAIDRSRLSYPTREWTVNGTPEFLGRTKDAKKLLDGWGVAVTNGQRIIKEVEAGSKDILRSPAEQAFAELALELHKKGDAQALTYLSGQDPTFTVFLLDARKPGYYIYNGDKTVVGRILKAKAAARLGIRRIDQGEGGNVIPSTYLYRPARVLERLREIEKEPAEPDEEYPVDIEPARRLIAPYRDRLAAAAASR